MVIEDDVDKEEDDETEEVETVKFGVTIAFDEVGTRFGCALAV